MYAVVKNSVTDHGILGIRTWPCEVVCTASSLVEAKCLAKGVRLEADEHIVGVFEMTTPANGENSKGRRVTPILGGYGRGSEEWIVWWPNSNQRYADSKRV